MMFNDMMHDGGGDDDPWKAAAGIALVASASDGPLPIGDIVGVGALAIAAGYDLTQRVYLTYTLEGPNGKIYVGRTSGFGSPEKVMMKRFRGHHMAKKFGYKNPKIDVYAQGVGSYYAIRGREQQLIDYHGGVGSPKVGNAIRGVSKYNPAGRLFHNISNSFFGNIAPYTGY